MEISTDTRIGPCEVNAAHMVGTLAVSPDGRRIVVSATERPSDLVLVEGLSGVTPGRDGAK